MMEFAQKPIQIKKTNRGAIGFFNLDGVAGRDGGDHSGRAMVRKESLPDPAKSLLSLKPPLIPIRLKQWT